LRGRSAAPMRPRHPIVRRPRDSRIVAPAKAAQRL